MEQLESRQMLAGVVTPFATLSDGVLTYGVTVSGSVAPDASGVIRDVRSDIYLQRYLSNSTDKDDFPILFDNPEVYDFEAFNGRYVVASEQVYYSGKGFTYSKFGERIAPYFIIVEGSKEVAVAIPKVPITDSDTDDVIAEASQLGNTTRTRYRSGRIANPYDVDMYGFWAPAGREISIDIDTATNGGGQFNSQLRLFDAQGKVVAENDNGKDYPRESTLGADSFLTFKIPTAGTYFIGISNHRNAGYSARVGNTDGLDYDFFEPRLPSAEVGDYKLIVRDNDPDDQFREEKPDAIRMDIPKTFTGDLGALDVDIRAIDVVVGQTIAFDVDLIDHSKRMLLRLFDSQGAILPVQVDSANDKSNITAPREFATADPYREHRFEKAGTYYVVLSAFGNSGYNPDTGEMDGGGSVGKYELEMTPIYFTFKTPALTNRISAVIAMPNRDNHLVQTVATLKRVTPSGATGGNILAGVTTWIVIHGRIDSSESFKSLAGSIDNYRSTDQVLLLDWERASHDNTERFQSRLGLGFNGAEWTPYIAQWVAQVARERGITPSRCILVGHSWGSYLAYEIGHEMKGVKALVAMDPALYAVGYNYQAVNYSRVSALSWAFYGSGTFGSATLSGTADEAFFVSYAGIYPTPFGAHSAPIALFHRLVLAATYEPNPPRSELFSMSRLLDGRVATRLTHEAFQSAGTTFEGRRLVFEGVFRLSRSGDSWKIDSFTYLDAFTKKYEDL